MAPTATKSTAEVTLDVGILYAAPIGTAEPASATATLDAAWREVGYTEDGSSFVTEVSSQDVMVEELLDPVRTVNVSRKSKLSFEMAQASRRNLILALNQGAAGANTSAVVEPAALSAEVRVMLLWVSEATGASASAFLARQCYNVGGLKIDRKQAPDKARIPVEFALEKPSSAAAFTFFPNASGVL